MLVIGLLDMSPKFAIRTTHDCWHKSLDRSYIRLETSWNLAYEFVVTQIQNS